MPHKDKRIRTVYFRKYQTKRRIEYKIKLNNYKKSIGKCKLCGWNKHPEILQFHHRNKKDKRYGFNTGHIGCYSWKTVETEIKKCDLLCANCHNWLHYKEKKWFKKVAKQ